MNKSFFFLAAYLIGIVFLIGYMFLNIPSALASENLSALPANAAISIEPSKEIPLKPAGNAAANPGLSVIAEAARYHKTFETSA